MYWHIYNFVSRDAIPEQTVEDTLGKDNVVLGSSNDGLVSVVEHYLIAISCRDADLGSSAMNGRIT